MQLENSLDSARQADQQDPLRIYRDQFFFPQYQGQNCLYFCGNSLGLQPKGIRPAILRELDHWAEHGVEGHFRGDQPWMYYHRLLSEAAARLVGATPQEVVVMNTLTTNLHLMMVSFYQPSAQRFKIVMEAGAFPSDQYAMESQVRWHGYDPETAIIEVAPRPGEDNLRTEDILQIIVKEGDSIALVMFGGVNYYTGQWYDMEKITAAGHRAGALVGFDLAHAAGNVPMHLHDWSADFAVWCSYKYLNSSPGGPSGVFVHERHANRPDLPRFAGWWGHDEQERFQMKKGFKPMQGAEGWQLSNAPILSFAAHKASLELFESAGMEALRAKSVQLTAYMEQVLKDADGGRNLYRMITPTDPNARGCQISLLSDSRGKSLFEHLSGHGVVADWREPNVIRLAPVPLYNSFEDVWQLGEWVKQFR